jgi:predicted acyltransferase
MEVIKIIAMSLLALLISATIIYGCYWVAKSVSYAIFYEDMVRATVSEMVKPEYLN